MEPWVAILSSSLRRMSQEMKRDEITAVQYDRPICPVCSSEDGNVLGRRHEYAIFKCSDCSLVYKYIPNLNRNLTQSLQDVTYHDSTLAARTRSRLVRRMANDRLRVLQKHMRTGQMLEVGCATGEFLQVSGAAGFDVQGVDSSRMFVDLMWFVCVDFVMRSC